MDGAPLIPGTAAGTLKPESAWVDEGSLASAAGNGACAATTALVIMRPQTGNTAWLPNLPDVPRGYHYAIGRCVDSLFVIDLLGSTLDHRWKRQCRMRLFCHVLALLVLGSAAPAAHAGPVRIKDITDVEGIRSNQLIGYGLVVGLNGTGDRLNNSVFTRESLISMLERLGVNIRDQEAKLQTKDIAAVMVTADLPAFAHSGSRIDITVSAAGDATDLSGGTLLVTPLMAADGEVYAVAQGQLVTSAFTASGSGASVTRNIPTSARIANGASVERQVATDLAAKEELSLGLRNPDLTTAERISSVINDAIGASVAKATDPRTVALSLHGRDVVTTLSIVEDLTVEPDQPAIVVVDEASGTIVMGDNVRISTVAIAQGNLTIQVAETPLVSQPGPFAAGQTAIVPDTSIKVDTATGKRLGILKEGPSLRDLVSGLNALGVGPRDMISILQTIKSAGALQANLVVR